jgi:TBCC domain-containing protein 1
VQSYQSFLDKMNRQPQRNSHSHSHSHSSSSISVLSPQELTAKPHAFAGAVLTPKHARELTPKTVLSMAQTLGYHALDHAPPHPTPVLSRSNEDDNEFIYGMEGGGDREDYMNSRHVARVQHNLLPHRLRKSQVNASHGAEWEGKVQYTVWITEAWRVLGWAEPSAALFWEMATMYHTLYVAARSMEVEELEYSSGAGAGTGTGAGGHHKKKNRGRKGSVGSSFKGGQSGEEGDEEEEVEDDEEEERFGIKRTLSQTIPPILSCGSSASMDSVEKKYHDAPTGGGKMGLMGESDDMYNHGLNAGGGRHSPTIQGKKGPSSLHQEKKNQQHSKASAASAKELPVWLVGTFLLLHCEDKAFWRNVSGEDEQRFDALMAKQQGSSAAGFGEILGKGVDFSALLMKHGLSTRTKWGYNAGNLDQSHCAAYLLRHLRKFLLLACVPHNSDALLALYELALSECPHDDEYMMRQHGPSRNQSYTTMDTEEILRRHEDEHGKYGLDVRMTVDDLERLNLVIQAPSGGIIDDPPLCISDSVPQEDLALYGHISLGEVERELRRQLQRELSGYENIETEEKDAVDAVGKDLGKISLQESKEVDKTKKTVRPEDDDDYKEMTYTKVRGSTILLKPNTHNKTIGNTHDAAGVMATSGRLHDIHVSGCSDSHMYLLQPFEHATISACSGCTIVVGAVAGLLYVVDCERVTITSAARRVLVSNCYDVTHNIFTPSPPLLVGDNRNCKFAPYNTYYDGLRDDLMATGLAAAVLSPEYNVTTTDPLYGPALQCASNKWKQPVELAKLSDLLQAQSLAPRASSPTPGADEKAFSKAGSTDDTVKIPTLVPASEFQVLFVPFLSEAAKERRARMEVAAEEMTVHTASSAEEASSNNAGPKNGIGSMYCHNLADVLQLSPFRLPTEYERRAIVKADRIKNLQTIIQTDLTAEQQAKLEDELNSGFRDWLVTSGNLRQVLDLVHLERKDC